MTIIAIQVEPYVNPFNIIYTNYTLVNKLKIPHNKYLNLSFGNKKIPVRIQIGSNKGNSIRIPKNIANELLIPNGIQIHAKYENGTIKLGPLLGILVQNIQDNQPKNPLGKFSPFAEELSKKSFTKGLLPFFFTYQDINQESNYITGWMYRNSKWEKRKFPISEVIYNRVSSRVLEKKLLPSITKLKDKYNFIFFNERFLDKWEIAQMLKPTSVKKIIPKTVIYRGRKTIREMINSFQTIYLKPTNGALGIGIFRIEKEENQYKVQYSRVQGPITLTFKKFEAMYNYLYPRLALRPYLVQQGLKLLSLNNRPIDFRILVQKNSKGIWAVTSMVARIANDQNFVSNLAQGGTQTTVYEAIKSAKPEFGKIITKNHFKEIALQIANIMEKNLPGNFAEFGIDLALDEKGKIWLIEVNSKPSKIDDLKDSNEPRPSVTQLANYVLYLSKFLTSKKHRQKSGVSNV